MLHAPSFSWGDLGREGHPSSDEPLRGGGLGHDGLMRRSGLNLDGLEHEINPSYDGLRRGPSGCGVAAP